jgi:two-component system alkaline phosphatase synthesis response regulator PhoP
MVSGAIVYPLSYTQAKLLGILMEYAPRAIRREVLIAYIWETDFIGNGRILDRHIRDLRKKLAKNKIWKIETVRSLGYRLTRQIF